MKTTFLKSSGIVTLALVAMTGAANAQTRIRLNGQPFRPAVPPVTQDGRVLVPMRAIFEALGANVDFFPADASIVARRDRTVVRMQLGSTRASVNREPVRLDVPATAAEGRTMVPLRFVSEALGANVNYDSYRQLVTIEDGDGNGNDGRPAWRPDRGPRRDGIPGDRPRDRDRDRFPNDPRDGIPGGR